MDKAVLAYVDLDGKPHLTGRLWAHSRKNKESATFEYDASWLENPERFSLEPALQLGPGHCHPADDLPMFGAIGDSAPDRWGRALMRRMERRRADHEKQTPRTLTEIDYLLLVDDETRAGLSTMPSWKGAPSCGSRKRGGSRRLWSFPSSWWPPSM
jgi:serine/threonine-protein kinase HipA